MTQAQLYREVARATGECVGFVRGMGFSLVAPPHAPRRPPGAQRRHRRQRGAKEHVPPGTILHAMV